MAVFFQPNPLRDKHYIMRNVDAQDALDLIEQTNEIVRDDIPNLRNDDQDDEFGSDETQYTKHVFNPAGLGLSQEAVDRLNTLLGEKLSVSKIPRQRGRRAVFVSLEEGVVYVAKTVIFNPNNATLFVFDNSIDGQIQDFVGIVEAVRNA